MEKISLLPNFIFKFRAPSDLTEKALTEVRQLEYESDFIKEISKDRKLHKSGLFLELTEWFNSCLAEVNSDLGYSFERLEVSLMWANRSHPGQTHPPHMHFNSFASGIFYLAPSDVKTHFGQPNFWFPEKNLFHHPTPASFFLEDSYSDSPGDLIVFPSSLFHKVPPNTGGQPRYTLSFNSFPFGVLGDERTSTFLELSKNNETNS